MGCAKPVESRFSALMTLLLRSLTEKLLTSAMLKALWAEGLHLGPT